MPGSSNVREHSTTALRDRRRGTSADQDTLGVNHDLPISKLHGLPASARAKLKRRRITTCAQLLAAAGAESRREALLAATGLDPAVLLQLVRRADLARIRGIGTVFELMLEEIGVLDVVQLAAREPVELHAALRTYNLEQRLARRSPTFEEVADWVATARDLPVVVSGESPASSRLGEGPVVSQEVV